MTLSSCLDFLPTQNTFPTIIVGSKQSPSYLKMVSLWGSKNNGNGDDQPRSRDVSPADGEGSRDGSQRYRDPDERSRLLPPPRRDGYLDPDDPAVCLSYLSYIPETVRKADHLNLGLALQPMERTSSPLLDAILPHHHFHLVDYPTRIHLRVATVLELSGFWLLQLRIHYPHRGEPPHHYPILLDSIQSNADLRPNRCRFPDG